EELAKTDSRAPVGLMLAQARCGRHADAAALAERFAASSDPNLLYQAGCGFALSASAVRSSRAITTAHQALEQKYLDGAIVALGKAVMKGWKNPATLRTTPDLDPIRAYPCYTALAKDVQAAAGGN